MGLARAAATSPRYCHALVMQPSNSPWTSSIRRTRPRSRRLPPKRFCCSRSLTYSASPGSSTPWASASTSPSRTRRRCCWSSTAASTSPAQTMGRLCGRSATALWSSSFGSSRLSWQIRRCEWRCCGFLPQCSWRFSRLTSCGSRERTSSLTSWPHDCGPQSLTMVAVPAVAVAWRRMGRTTPRGCTRPLWTTRPRRGRRTPRRTRLGGSRIRIRIARTWSRCGSACAGPSSAPGSLPRP
mmetsp:Transcript_22523/g.64838  ORF Transcript_22523/g.64838 Transcript_22523/m.64838 type:complete len:240 (+) Transcript_22523:436-1155(+)